MALFQRIKTPLAEMGFEGEVPLPAGPRSAGDALRQQREALGLNFSDVAGALRIKPAYLAAIEEGRPDRLPGPAYAAGFVRAYGDHLGLDGAEILRRFRLEAAGLDAKPDLSFPVPLGERSVPGRAMLLLALILAICGYGAWYYLSTDELARPERVTEVPATLLPPKPAEPATSAPPAPIAPATSATTTVQAGVPPSAPIAPATSATATGKAVAPPSEPVSGTEIPAASEAEAAPSASPPPAAATIPGIPATPPAPVPATTSAAASVPHIPSTSAGAAAGSVRQAESGTPQTYGAADGSTRIVLRANTDSWIQVRDSDHLVLFTGVLKPGESYRVPDRAGLSMRAGNAGGLDVMVDGKPAPSLGPVGAVRNVALNPQLLTAGNTTHN
jgi:cytoskeleton protein RodZ